jgi:DnaJ-class molecular chaperone
MTITTGHKWVAAPDERTWRSVEVVPCGACQGTGLHTLYFDRGQAVHLADAPPCGWCGGTGTRSVHCGAGDGETWEYDAEAP